MLELLLKSFQAFIVSLTSDTATRPLARRIAYGCSSASSHALFCGLSAELARPSVSVINMVAAKQVVTGGIRRRSPPDFPFFGYSTSEIFKQPFKSILVHRGAGMNGQCVVVGEENKELAHG